MIKLNKLHHVAILCSDYYKSKAFYTEILGLKIIQERYRKERQSYKLDLSLNGEYIIELFTFPNPPSRITFPEATGLRHLAFEVDDINVIVKALKKKNIAAEQIRMDTITGKQFIFIFDPDKLPIELYTK